MRPFVDRLTKTLSMCFSQTSPPSPTSSCPPLGERDESPRAAGAVDHSDRPRPHDCPSVILLQGGGGGVAAAAAAAEEEEEEEEEENLVVVVEEEKEEESRHASAGA